MEHAYRSIFLAEDRAHQHYFGSLALFVRPTFLTLGIFLVGTPAISFLEA